MEVRLPMASSLMTAIVYFLTFIVTTNTCKPTMLGGLVLNSHGCYNLCNVLNGEEVHVVFRDSDRMNRRGILTFAPLQEPKNIVLVLASNGPSNWVVYITENLNITELMLISAAPEAQHVTLYDEKERREVTPNVTIKRKLKDMSYGCISFSWKTSPRVAALDRYGYITSMSCVMHGHEWRLGWSAHDFFGNTVERPCTPNIGTPRPPTPSTKQPDIKLDKNDINKVYGPTPGGKTIFPDSMFIGVTMTALFGFLPLYLCLCCVCFRARRVRAQPPVVTGTLPVSDSVRSGVRIAGAYPPGEYSPGIPMASICPPKYPHYPIENMELTAPPPYEEVASPPPYELTEGTSRGKE